MKNKLKLTDLITKTEKNYNSTSTNCTNKGNIKHKTYSTLSFMREQTWLISICSSNQSYFPLQLLLHFRNMDISTSIYPACGL